MTGDGIDTEFPQSIGRVARRELAVNGYTRHDQLAHVSAAELLRILGEELASRVQEFRPD